ncbi:hypothetical protein MKW92_036160, partial [Papaver armeniacum]
SLKIKASLDAKKESLEDGESTLQLRHLHFANCLDCLAAINSFRIHCLDGDGGCGRVHKGRLESTNQ